MAASGDEAVRVYRVENVHEHPKYGYIVDGRELYARLEEIEGAGLAARGDLPLPPAHRADPLADGHQPRRRRGASGRCWPGTLYIIVGFETAQPQVRAYRIESSSPEEVELSVE